jgi:hypothetical protein
MTDWRELCAELLAMLDAQALRDPEMDGGLLRHRARTALAQPEPEGPTDQELLRLLQVATPCYTVEHYRTELNAIRQALARFARPTIKPVPVAERLPGPEDCDAGGCCWLWEADINGHEPLGHWSLQNADWASDPDGDASHWLPHRALPVPGAEASN